MSNAWGHVVGIVTLVLMASFIGIWIWAWRPRHARVFDSLARIPMADIVDDASVQERDP